MIKKFIILLDPRPHALLLSHCALQAPPSTHFIEMLCSCDMTKSLPAVTAAQCFWLVVLTMLATIIGSSSSGSDAQTVPLATLSSPAPAPAPAPMLLLNATAWRGFNSSFYFPELALPAVASRPPTAVVFSGGGSRSFTTTIGQLAALEELDLMPHIRYITGVSGGSWATTTYAFSTEKNVTKLLGNTLDPTQLSLARLAVIPKGCARRAAVDTDMVSKLLKYYLSPSCRSEYAWVEAAGDVYLRPFGVPDGVGMAWNDSAISDIKARNPAANISLVAPRPNSPYFVWAITLLGPLADAPFPEDKRMYTLLEATPGYVGEAYTQNVSYTSKKHSSSSRISSSDGGDAAATTTTTATAASTASTSTTIDNSTVGGYIEAFAFGSDTAPSAGGLGQRKSAELRVNRPALILSPILAAGASSMAPADALATLLGRGVAKDFTLRFPYWAPSATAPRAWPGVVGDGGDYENMHLIGMLQRGVRGLVMFCNCEVVLSSTYNASSGKPPTPDDLDDDIPAFFGIDVDRPNHPLYTFTRDQAFPPSDFPRLIEGWQQAQASGRSAIVTLQHTTVSNPWWGLEAGMRVNVTWIYQSRAFEWEAQLPDDTKKALVPAKTPQDPASRVKHGTFKDFPNVPTSDLHYKAELASAVSNLAGWVVHRHADEIRGVLTGTSPS